MKGHNRNIEIIPCWRAEVVRARVMKGADFQVNGSILSLDKRVEPEIWSLGLTEPEKKRGEYYDSF